jgi:hypothetical protein
LEDVFRFGNRESEPHFSVMDIKSIEDIYHNLMLKYLSAKDGGLQRPRKRLLLM